MNITKSGSTTTHYPFSDYEVTDDNQTLSIYVYDQVVAVAEATPTTTTLVHNGRDHLGSTRAVTDVDAHLTQVLDYYPFGNARIEQTYGDTSQDIQYVGTRHDEETDLNLMGQRYYRGTQGQFLSQDRANVDLGSQSWESQYGRPLELFLRDPQQLNTYSYARNNPIVNTDPGGDILPLVLAIGYAGLTAYDVYSTGQTLADPNAGFDEKALAVGLFASPVGELKALGNLGEQAIKKGSQIPDVMSAIRYGQQMHKSYSPFGQISNSRGVFVGKEVNLGIYGRADAVKIDSVNRTVEIRELKPNNPIAIHQGEKQLQRYSEYYRNNSDYKGYKITTKVDTYTRKKTTNSSGN